MKKKNWKRREEKWKKKMDETRAKGRDDDFDFQFCVYLGVANAFCFTNTEAKKDVKYFDRLMK